MSVAVARVRDSAAAAPILLYSTNTWLAYIISETYYREHYVWCTPFSGPGSVAGYDSAVPPSSSPLEIYRELREDVRRGDQHSRRVAQSRTGLLRGAELKLAAGVITEGVGDRDRGDRAKGSAS